MQLISNGLIFLVRFRYRLGGAVVILLATSSRGDTTQETRQLIAATEQILNQNCSDCHGPDSVGEGGINFISDLQRIVSSQLVRPGDPANSTLIQRVQTVDPTLRMPQGAPALTTADIATLVNWVQRGAPTSASPQSDQVVSFRKILDKVAEDLNRAEEFSPAALPFLRYLTLAHLLNFGVSGIAFDAMQNSLSQTLNSLSIRPIIVRPISIDAGHSIFRIDIRDYGWTIDQWNSLTAGYPYTGRTAIDEVRVIRNLTGAIEPILRADWFMITATRPPHYHNFLGIPETFNRLAENLNINVVANIENSRPLRRTAWRAGFINSGVSNFNRVIERQSAPNGYLWRSYDFAAEAAEKNILVNPLGPGREFGTILQTGEELGFVQDGGEVIYSLPNGLQGYMLFNSEGGRLDVGPANIVFHRQRGEPITNGISCMSCHSEGIISKQDDVFPFVNQLSEADISRFARERILRLYQPQAELSALYRTDQSRFNSSLLNSRIVSGNNAINNLLVLADDYNLPLTLRRAIAELGISGELEARAFFATLVDSPRRTIAPLLANRTLARSAFEFIFPAITDAYNNQSRDFVAGYRSAELRTTIDGQNGASLTMPILDFGRIVAIELEVVVQQARPCMYSMILESPSGKSVTLRELGGSTPCAPSVTESFTSSADGEAISGLIGEQVSGSWRFRVLPRSPRANDALGIIRKLRLSTTGQR